MGFLKSAIGGFIFAVTIGLSQPSVAGPFQPNVNDGLSQDGLVHLASSVEKQAKKSLQEKLRVRKLKWGAPVFIRIFKREALLEVWLRDGDTYRNLHTYPICTFSGFLGPKLKEGDRQSPEGFYVVTKKQLNPTSRYYRAFNIAYPNEYDRAHGRTGSALMVHGNCVSIGCYAMTDPGIGEIYQIVEAGLNGRQKAVPVHIFPFRMSAENLSIQPKGKWTGFWKNMKTGHDLFVKNKVPPKAYACGKKYGFGEKKAGCRLIAGWR